MTEAMETAVQQQKQEGKASKQKAKSVSSASSYLGYLKNVMLTFSLLKKILHSEAWKLIS